MPKIENPLGPGFEWRLRATLDRVHPPHSKPRYTFVTPGATLRTVLVRAAPAVAVAFAGLLLTAYAATGSPNPVIWTQNAASAITSITHAPEASPAAEPSSAPVQAPTQSQPPAEQEPAESKSESSSESSKEPEQPESSKSTAHPEN